MLQHDVFGLSEEREKVDDGDTITSSMYLVKSFCPDERRKKKTNL